MLLANSLEEDGLKTQTNKILLEKRVNQVYQYWKKQEFPYYPRDKKYRREQFKKFMKTNDLNSLDFSNRIFTFNHLGLSLAWSYFRHAFEVRCNNFKSPYECFNNKTKNYLEEMYI